MLKTILLLIATVIILPIIAFNFDQPLTTEQFEMLRTSLLMMLSVAGLCFVVSELTGNCSQVDKLWSVIPMVYVWYFAAAGGWNPRMVLMAAVATIWGIRLTYNFSRRGAYRIKFWEGEEDYRWEVLRQMPMFKSKLRWSLFNLFFISLYQNTLILFFTLPILMAAQGTEQALGLADYFLAAVFVGFVALETIADEQQWMFQNEKHRLIKAGEKLEGDYAQGFLSSGLWAKVRHPNYASEQAIWITFYFFSVAATGRWINWSLAGSLLLLLLFQGSADFSENISAGKYAGYKEYQKRVRRFIPKFF